jgi:hypothetical protein
MKRRGRRSSRPAYAVEVLECAHHRPLGGHVGRHGVGLWGPKTLVRGRTPGARVIAVDPVPLADVERVWEQEGDGRVVFVP